MSSYRQGTPMTAFEAEHKVAALRALPLREVGSERWLAQHQALEDLNVAAHHNALSRHDEYVVEAFAAEPGAVRTLVHELLAVETWRAAVLPHMLAGLGAAASVKVYMAMYHEATVCNLLEVLLYHRSVAEAADESLVELVDYCARKMNALNAGAFRRAPEPREGEPAHLADLRRQAHEVGFAVATCAVSIFRFVTDHAPHCSVGVIGRMLDTNDAILALAMLAQRPPWTRRSADKRRLEKFVQQKWVEVQPADAERLTQLEGQVWLALYNLIMEPECRRRYRWLAHRKDRVTDLRRLFSETLMDQLPPLRDLQRAVEELALQEPPAPAESAPCVIEQMPELREALEQEAADGEALARELLAGAFSNDPEQRRRDMARLAATYNLDNFDEVLSDPVCAAPGCGQTATNRCSRCKAEWYCSRQCQLKSWKSHKALCAVLARDRQEREREAAAQSAAGPAPAPIVVSGDAARQARQKPRQAEGPRIQVVEAGDDGDDDDAAAQKKREAEPKVLGLGGAGPSRRVLIEEMD